MVAAVQALEETTAYGDAHRAGRALPGGGPCQRRGLGGGACQPCRRAGAGHPAADAPAGEPPARRGDGDCDADPSIEAATAGDLTAAHAIRERIRTSGFTAEETAELQAEGLTASEIAETRQQLGAPLPDATPMTPAAALSAAADEIDTATCIDDTDLCGFDELGRAASAAGANGATHRP